MGYRLQYRGDTLANWMAEDPVLMDREMVLVATDGDRPHVYDERRIGDGVSRFSELEPVGFDCVQEEGDSTVYPMSQAAVSRLLRQLRESEVVMDYETFGRLHDEGGLDEEKTYYVYK